MSKEELLTARGSLEKKFNLIRDHVTAAAKKFKNGYYLHGRGGTGKSYTVISQLDSLQVSYELYNSRMTARGLFDTLRIKPEGIHILEDCEKITKDPDAQGVLRSALWAQPGKDRVVTWTTGQTAKDNDNQFTFHGSIILISNRPLANMPELRALATRIEVHQFEPTEEELTALMIELATKGYHRKDQGEIAPEECLKITDYLLKECQVAACQLDLRLQQKSFQTYLQWQMDMAICHWEDLIAASVRETAYHFRHEMNLLSYGDKLKEKRNFIRESKAATNDKNEILMRYIEKGKGSRADFYRHWKDVESGNFDEQDAA